MSFLRPTLLAALVSCSSVAATGARPAPAGEPVARAGTAQAATPADPARHARIDSQGSVRFDAGRSARLVVERAPTGHLLVRPEINGREAGWFIFDTGAGICVVSTPHTAELGLERTGEVQALGVGGAKSAVTWSAQTLSLGPVTLTDHPLMETDLSFLAQHLGREIAGIVGYGVLAKCVAEIDLAGAAISIHDPATYELAKGAWMPLSIDDRVPSVRARFEDKEGLFRLDTGARGSVTFHEPATRRWKLLEGRETRDTEMGGVGGFVAGKTGELAWFELAGVRRERVPAVFATEAVGTFAESSKDGNVGTGLLEPFVIVTDYPGRRIALVERGGPAPGAGIEGKRGS